MLGITAEDRLAIHDVIALHGHVADDRDWDRLGDLFTDDAVRHEAPSVRAEVEGLRRLAVAAAGLKLRAA